jgi:hypothetical protein
MINNLTTVVGITVFSFLLSSPFILQAQQVYGKIARDAGYDDGREDRINGNSYNDYCSPSLDDDLGCAAYKAGYAFGWNAAGLLYGGQDNSRDYEEPGEYYNNYDDDDE